MVRPIVAIMAALLAATAGTIGQSYRAVEGWGAWSAATSWGEVAGITVDASGRIFVVRRSDPPVVELDVAGAVRRTWGSGKFVWPRSIRVDRSGFIWIADGRGRKGQGQQVFKYTRDGQLVMTLGIAGVSGDGPDTFNGPADVAVAANGDLFVADGDVNARIVKFSKEGRFIKSWGRKGAGPGEFNLPNTLAFDTNGRLLVGDRANKRIQIFDQDGNFLDQWPQFGSPSGLFVAPDDTLYVVDDRDRRKLFVGSATDGSVTHTVDNLTLADAVTVDRQGNIYVSESRPGKSDDGVVTGYGVRKLVKN